MNKNDKIWVAVLIAALAGYMLWSYSKPATPNNTEREIQNAERVIEGGVSSQTPSAQSAVHSPTNNSELSIPHVEVAPAPTTIAPAQAHTYTLENEQVKLTISSQGGRLTQAELLAYKSENREDAAPVILQTGDLLNAGWADVPVVDFVSGEVKEGKELILSGMLHGVAFKRTVTLGEDYAVTVKDSFLSAEAKTLPAYTMDAGSFFLSNEEGDMVAADALVAGESGAEHYESEMGKFLGAGSAFLGCGTSSNAAGLPASREVPLTGLQTWVALKNRFFVTLVQPPSASTATLKVSRDTSTSTLKVNAVSAKLAYPEVALRPNAEYIVTTRLYVGPKRLSCLNAFGSEADEVMDFGFFGWVCALLLPILNMCYALIPNYGVAILLLTLLVRIVFWPLTHKSTVAMRKMSVIQPQIKEIQAKFKDNPQKVQQETFKLYRDHKVNPLSSCFPMLVQIPIFIALFTVLRSAVELRFASFLWISDLSQPENLFAGILPMPLNILPILTAVTMGLQTHFSPSTGDPAQKKMMTWMMPIMLLFMFYSMPSALCLYWTASQVLSIIQMWQIQRQTAKEQALTAK